MAFPTFSPGDVLNASDMNAVGLWLLTTNTFTTTTGFNLPDNSFTSAYQNYRLMVKITATAVDADFTGRMRASGVNLTTGYASAAIGNNNTSPGTASNVGDSAATAWQLGQQDVNANFQIYTLSMDFYSPQLAAITSGFMQYQFTDKAATAFFYRHGGFTLDSNTNVYDSFAFISTQNVTGRYWLYGYRGA